MRTRKLQSCSELIEYIDKIGFLPLLGMGINGWSAEEMMDQEFQYTPARWWMGVAAMEMERHHLAGKRLRLRQIFRQKSSIHQPQMVARFL